jgi:pimeloyl-ACP methyl ester carboxylesterase
MPCSLLLPTTQQLPPHQANLRSSFERSPTTSIMPPGGVKRIARRLIHRSAWKVNSANFGGIEKGHVL